MRKSKALTFSSILFASSSAFAEVPAAATTALTDSVADVGTVGWAVFGVLVAAAAFKYIRRVL